MSLDNKVKAMIISEFPIDSVVGGSNQTKDAREGILEYVKHEKPDVVFVDGLISRIRYPEAYLDEILDGDPVLDFMEGPFKKATEFLNQVQEANPKGKLYMCLSDADEDNIRRLTKRSARLEIEKNKLMIDDTKLEIKNIDDSVRNDKKMKTKGWKERVEKMYRRKGGLRSKLKNITQKAMIRQPNQESPEWRNFKEGTSKEYLTKLSEMNPTVDIFMGHKNLEAKGYTFEYAHSFYKASSAVLTSRTNKLVEQMDKLQMGGVEIPNFIVESGHHGETMLHPYRHGEDDVYSLLCTGLVMEDQRVVKQIIDGDFKPELFQGKTTKLEACQRQNKKMPASGIMMFGRDKEGYFGELYSMEHLANVGQGKVNLDGIEFETFNILSDIHVGKGAVRYDKLESALDKMQSEIDECIEKGKTVPVLMVLNESLQGSNYKSMPVETPRLLPDELEEKMDACKTRKELEDMVKGEFKKLNDPCIDNQLDWYYLLTDKVVLPTLMHGSYEKSVVYNEATHVAHTVGEFGITEVGLQSIVYKQLSRSVPLLKKYGEIKEDSKLNDIKDKMLICKDSSGYKKFNMDVGDITYKISSVHKPGGAGPGSNIPMKHVKRAITMSDDADIIFSAHLHTPYMFAIGRLKSNDMVAFYKGATFNEYDDYGKAGGWSPAVVGYEKAIVPKTKDAKGIYKVRFITSDVL